jgi:WD40 repeat protein
VQLAQALEQDDTLWVVLVMREDYVAALDPYLHLLPERLRHRFYMERMDIDAAQEAIEKPAEHAGRYFAPGVALALVDNLRQIRTADPAAHEHALGQYVEPVQLQVVCYQLWQRLGDRAEPEITMDDLQGLGDVDTALADFYERAIATVVNKTGAPAMQLRNWFERRLITEAGTRGTAFQGATETAGLDNGIVRALADQFIVRADLRAGGTWFELVHDRFVDPILQANQAWRLAQDPLIRTAEEWDRSGRGAALLIQGAQLEEALARIDPAQAEPIVGDFLVASQDAQNQRDLALARERAAADERRAEEEARRARRLRLISAVLVVALVFAIAAATWAGVQAAVAGRHQAAAERDSTRAVEQSLRANAESTRAVEQRLIADAESTRAIEEEQRARAESTRAAREQVEAETASTRAAVEKATADAASTRAAAEQQTAEAELAVAEDQRATADAARADSARQGQLLLAQSLAFAALNVSQLGDDTEQATLLALEALAIHRRERGELDTGALTALLSILSRPYSNVTLSGHQGAVHALAFSPGAGRLASAGDDGVIRIWSLEDALAPPLLLADHDGAVRALQFAGEDTVLSGGDDALVRVWSLDTPAEPADTIQEAGAIASLALSPDGRQLVTSLASGTIHSWDLDEPEDGPAVLSTWFEPGFRPVAFQVGQGGLLAGNPSGALQAWRGGSVFAPPTFIGQAQAPVTAVSAAGGDSVFAAADGSIRIRRQVGLDVTVTGHGGAVNGVAISGDAQLVASGGEDGTVRFWIMPGPGATTTTASAVLEGHEGPVRAVSFAPDDRLLASAGADGTIRLWRLAPAFDAMAGGAPVLYAPDGAQMVTVSEGREALSSTHSRVEQRRTGAACHGTGANEWCGAQSDVQPRQRPADSWGSTPRVLASFSPGSLPGRGRWKQRPVGSTTRCSP